MARIVIIRNASKHDFGGGERFPVFVAEILKEQNIVTYLISRNMKLLSFARESGITTVKGWWWSNQNWSGGRALMFPIYTAWQLVLYVWYLAIFARLKPDAVHIQSKDDFIAATYAAKTMKATVVWTDHADLKHIWLNLQNPYKNPVGKWVYMAARKADAITVVSQSEYREVTQHLPSESPVSKNIQVIYNGVRDVYGTYGGVPIPKKFTFCVVSRLVTDKGVGETIKAFTALHQEFPASQLVFVGSGPEEEKFKRQAKNIPSIVFEGYRSDPLPFLASSHVVLQPTYHEGFSVALVEASMMKKPIIATKVGGNVEIIQDHNTGLLIQAKNPDSLHQAMRLLMQDAPLREKLAKNARQQYEEKFILDNIVKERFIPLYEATH